MKKVICALFTLLILLGGCTSLAANEYTLPQKLENQQKVGSGLKGSFTMHMEGSDPLILSLIPFQDQEIQIRAIRSGNDRHIALYREGQDESRDGLTELLQQDGSWFIRSDLLPDQVYRIPDAIQTAGLIHHPKGENPSFATAAARWYEMTESKRKSLLDPVTEKLSKALEVWLADYAGVSEVKTLANGSSAVDLTYTIPMAEIRKEIVRLVENMTMDADAQALLNSILTAEQQKIYMNQHLGYFYQAAMEALNNDYDLLYTRTVSTLGQMISSSLEMPLDERTMGYQSLLIEEAGGLISITLRGEDSLLMLTIPGNIDFSQIDAFNAWIVYRSGEDEDQSAAVPMALKIRVTHGSELSSDEENRNHLREHWVIQAERDVTRLPEGEVAENHPEMQPMSADLMLHYFSRTSQSSPTTLEIEALLEKEDFGLSLKGQVKTTSPWPFSPFSADEAIELANMEPEERSVLMAEWLTSAGEMLTRTGNASPAGDISDPENQEKPAEENGNTTAQNDKPEDVGEAEEPGGSVDTGEAEGPDVTAESSEAEESDGAEETAATE